MLIFNKETPLGVYFCRETPLGFYFCKETPPGFYFSKETPLGVYFCLGCKRYAQTPNWHVQVVEPMPDGANVWGLAMKRLWEEGVTSKYLDQNKAEEEWFEIEEKDGNRAFAPQEEEYVAAVSEIAAEGMRKLYHFPKWQKKFAYMMVREMGADPEITLAVEEPEKQEEWETMTEGVCASAKAKPKAATSAWGYRPRSP